MAGVSALVMVSSPLVNLQSEWGIENKLYVRGCWVKLFASRNVYRLILLMAAAVAAELIDGDCCCCLLLLLLLVPAQCADVLVDPDACPLEAVA